MRPSLQQIANMSREEGLAAVRQHYDPNWGLPLPDDHGELRSFSVTISYRTQAHEYYTIEAQSAEEAEEKAEAEFDKVYGADADIEDVIAEPVQ